MKKNWPTTMPETHDLLGVTYQYEYLNRAATAAFEFIRNGDGTHKEKCNAQRRFDRRLKQIATLLRGATRDQLQALMDLTDLTPRDIDAAMHA